MTSQPLPAVRRGDEAGGGAVPGTPWPGALRAGVLCKCPTSGTDLVCVCKGYCHSTGWEIGQLIPFRPLVHLHICTTESKIATV